MLSLTFILGKIFGGILELNVRPTVVLNLCFIIKELIIGN